MAMADSCQNGSPHDGVQSENHPVDAAITAITVGCWIVKGVMQRRYQALELHDAISRRNDYVEACRELRCVLRGAYIYAPPPFQARLYEDVVHAFRTLPVMENSRQLGAAKSLLQTREDLFLKQRLALAVHEYKTAMLAWHRQYKSPEPFPGNAYSYSGTYCSMYLNIWMPGHWPQLLRFAGSGMLPQLMTQCGIPSICISLVLLSVPKKAVLAQSFRSCFKRAYCPDCKGVMWLVEPPWKSAKGKCVARNQIWEHHSPRPMSVSQVVRDVVSKDTASASESSTSDSDSSSSELSYSLPYSDFSVSE